MPEMPQHQPKYQIKRTEEFIQKSVELGKGYKRTPDLIRAIDWALSRKPHYFNNVSGDYYLWVTEGLMSEDFPVVKILYKIIEDSDTVILLDIEEN